MDYTLHDNNTLEIFPGECGQNTLPFTVNGWTRRSTSSNIEEFTSGSNVIVISTTTEPSEAVTGKFSLEFTDQEGNKHLAKGTFTQNNYYQFYQLTSEIMVCNELVAQLVEQ